MCDDLLAALAEGAPLSTEVQDHVAGCARCQALVAAVHAPSTLTLAASSPVRVSPAALGAVVRRRAILRGGAVAAGLVVGLAWLALPVDTPQPVAEAPDLPALLALLDEDGTDPPGLEPLAALHPLPDPLADLPFASTHNPWSSE